MVRPCLLWRVIMSHTNQCNESIQHSTAYNNGVMSRLQPGFNFSAIEEYSVTGGGGTFSYPDNGTTLSLPVSGLYFLNITAADCPAFAAKPPGQLLKTHYFFGYRWLADPYLYYFEQTV